jgi:hypothetical protein
MSGKMKQEMRVAKDAPISPKIGISNKFNTILTIIANKLSKKVVFVIFSDNKY